MGDSRWRKPQPLPDGVQVGGETIRITRTATSHARVYRPVLLSEAYLKAPKSAILCYQVLCMWADGSDRRGDPGQREKGIARLIRDETRGLISERTVWEALAYLQRTGLITLVRRSYDREGRWYWGDEARTKGWVSFSQYIIHDDGPRDVSLCPVCGHHSHQEPGPECHRHVRHSLRPAPQNGEPPNAPTLFDPGTDEPADDQVTTALRNFAVPDDQVTTALRNFAVAPLREFAVAPLRESAVPDQTYVRPTSDPTPPTPSPSEGASEDTGAVPAPPPSFDGAVAALASGPAEQVEPLRAWLFEESKADPAVLDKAKAADPTIRGPARAALEAAHAAQTWVGSCRNRYLPKSLPVAALGAEADLAAWKAAAAAAAPELGALDRARLTSFAEALAAGELAAAREQATALAAAVPRGADPLWWLAEQAAELGHPHAVDWLGAALSRETLGRLG